MGSLSQQPPAIILNHRAPLKPHKSLSVTQSDMLLLLSILSQLTFLIALPVNSVDDLNTRIVNREDTTASSVGKTITGSLVQDVKQINILLNIPNGCNAIYDSMISQLQACREGTDRGHSGLDNGCLLKIDFQGYKDQCRNSKLSFPTNEETPWHPDPTCNGEYCQESSNLEFTGRDVEDANVAFPDERPY